MRHNTKRMLTANRGKRSRRIAALVAVGALWSASTAQAVPCTTKAVYDGANFDYELCTVPDFDQRRGQTPFGSPGLPNNGNWYCVPTSAVDWMAYIANHGYPSVEPGPGEHNGLGDYDDI